MRVCVLGRVGGGGGGDELEFYFLFWQACKRTRGQRRKKDDKLTVDKGKHSALPVMPNAVGQPVEEDVVTSALHGDGQWRSLRPDIRSNVGVDERLPRLPV